MRRILLFAFAAAAGPCLRAAPIRLDLGEGLAFVRVHRLPADLPADVADRPLVLDIRYVKGDAAAGTDLIQWLRLHAAPRHPVFLLANEKTSGALLTPLDSPDSVVGLVILGPVAPNFSPDIALPVSPAVERRAYDALERGATVESLTDDTPIKSRQDEALLAREHLPDSALGDLADDASQEGASKPVAARPLIDSVLQRAIQLDRALLALKRL
jgi:hypothetical protein